MTRPLGHVHPYSEQQLFSASSSVIALQECCNQRCPTPSPELIMCKWSSCPQSFTRPEDLFPHLFENHLNKNSTKETKCHWESCSETVNDIFKHMTSHHLIRLWFACRWQNCTKRFEEFKTLTDHVSATHVGSGKREYQCCWSACVRQGRAFNQRQKLMRHLQVHTGSKPFQCEVCQERLSDAYGKLRHMRFHTGEKPYSCQECDKQFSMAASLTVHKRIHTGERPFRCKYQDCSKRFNESSNLTKHIRVHTKERPFQCKIDSCGKTFARPDQVTRHTKTHKRPLA